MGLASSFDTVVYRGDLEAKDVLAGYYREGVLRAAATIGRAKELIIVSEIIKAGGNIPASRFKDPEVDLFDWIKLSPGHD